MGYNLIIGEAYMDWHEEGVTIGVDVMSHPEAPSFGEPTDKQNVRWPSYTGWAEVCRNLDIVDIMMNHRNGGAGEFTYKGKFRIPLIETHPGASPITKEHLEYIEEKVEAYKAKYPDHIAEYAPLKPGVKEHIMNPESDYVDDPKYDGNLCRAEWLLFWMKWALENCEHPTFTNT